MSSRLGLLVFVIVFYSCKCDVESFILSEDELLFTPYSLGETITFRNVATDEVISFTAVEEDIREFEENNFRGHGPVFCSGNNDDSHQERLLDFSSSLGSECLMTYGVSTDGDPAGMRLSITGCGIDVFGTTPRLVGEDGMFILEGVTYNPTYILTNSTNDIHIVPQIGILSFVDDITGDLYLRID